MSQDLQFVQKLLHLFIFFENFESNFSELSSDEFLLTKMNKIYPFKKYILNYNFCNFR